MNALKKCRQQFISALWKDFKTACPDALPLESALSRDQVARFHLDHLAIIDLPSPHSGIPQLREIFSVLGFRARGRDYLPEKYNDFIWMTEIDAPDQAAHQALPQIVLADFRPEELPLSLQKILKQYTSVIPPSPLPDIQTLAHKIAAGDESLIPSLCALLCRYFSKASWPLPSAGDFCALREANELLAWVLVFGPRVNHFGISTHLLHIFKDFEAVTQFVGETLKLPLNYREGVIKGQSHQGIHQASTQGHARVLRLRDDVISIPGPFVELVWRYPLKTNPQAWQDYYTDFIAHNANRVIESLYEER